MILITDSNIIISALISPNGKVSKVLKAKSKIQYLAPNFVLFEIKKRYPKITKKTGLTTKEINAKLDILKEKIVFIDVDLIPKKFINEGKKIVEGVDEDDFVFVAMNRYLKHKLWTGDIELIKGLEQKGYKICVRTDDLIDKLYKKRL